MFFDKNELLDFNSIEVEKSHQKKYQRAHQSQLFSGYKSKSDLIWLDSFHIKVMGKSDEVYLFEGKI